MLMVDVLVCESFIYFDGIFIALTSFILTYPRCSTPDSNCKCKIGPKVDEILNPSKCCDDGA